MTSPEIVHPVAVDAGRTVAARAGDDAARRPVQRGLRHPRRPLAAGLDARTHLGRARPRAVGGDPGDRRALDDGAGRRDGDAGRHGRRAHRGDGGGDAPAARSAAADADAEPAGRGRPRGRDVGADGGRVADLRPLRLRPRHDLDQLPLPDAAGRGDGAPATPAGCARSTPPSCATSRPTVFAAARALRPGQLDRRPPWWSFRLGRRRVHRAAVVAGALVRPRRRTTAVSTACSAGR